MRFLYSLAAYLLTPLICVVMLWRGFGDRSYWRNFAERFGFGPRPAPGGIWIHAVSVGEVQASAPLVAYLRERYPRIAVTVTSLTPTGAGRARILFAGRAHVRYVPFDLPGSVRRFFRRVRPRLAVIFETELWPNLYYECGRRRIPLVLASARISPRSASRYRRLGGLFRDTLSRGVVIAAQGSGDADRFRSLGAAAERTHVTGNIKFDVDVPADLADRAELLRRQYAPARAMWVAGSTHQGEEEQILEAQRIVSNQHPGTLLVLAPRHPNRFDTVAAVLKRKGVSFARRSEAGAAGAAGGVRAATPTRAEGAEDRSSVAAVDVLLLDTLGELLGFYSAADVAFVGGSLVPIGGHNLLEPAALAKPILTGPYNTNSGEIAALLIAQGAAAIVRNGTELGQQVAQLLSEPELRRRIGELARNCLDGNRGALAKLLSLIEPLLQE